jgi:hypothetical protein
LIERSSINKKNDAFLDHGIAARKGVLVASSGSTEIFVGPEAEPGVALNTLIDQALDNKKN